MIKKGNKSIKKIISLLCIFILLVQNLCVFSVYADDESASSMTADFLNFYNSSSASFDATELRVEDYYALGIFMSNFFQPGVTKLSDLTNYASSSSNFKTNFEGALYKSGNSDLAEIVDVIGSDIYDMLSGSNFQLKTSAGSFATGEDIIDAMVLSTVSSSSSSSLQIYHSTNKVAVDFSSEMYRAAWSVLFAYCPYLFTEDEGIRALNVLFIDALGNIWGSDTSVDLSNYTSITNLDSLGSEIYLVFPACLNPGAFSPGATSSAQLKFPATNSFVLGSFLDSSDYSSVANSFIPLTNVFGDSTSLGSAANSALRVYGVNALTPYVMNSNPIFSGASYSSDDKTADAATYLWNNALIQVENSANEGIPYYSTNSFFVINPNINTIVDLDNADDKIKTDGYNYAFDLDESVLFISDTAFDTVYQTGSYNKDATMGRLLKYMESGVAINFNQAALNYYSFTSTQLSSSDISQDVTEEYMYNYLASIMGLTNFNIMLESQLSAGETLEFGGKTYYTGIVEEGVSSLLSTIFRTDNTLEADEFEDFISSYSSIVGTDTLISSFIESDDSILYSKTSLQDIEGNAILGGYSNGSYTLLYPRIMYSINVGNSGSDVNFSGGLSFNDTYLSTQLDNATYWKTSSVDGIYKFEVPIGTSSNTALTSVTSEGALNYVYTNYVYTLFNGSNSIANMKVRNDTLETIFGTTISAYKSTLNLLDFSANKTFAMGLYFGYYLDTLNIDSCTADSLDFGDFGSSYIPTYTSISATGVQNYTYGGSDGTAYSSGAGISTTEEDSLVEKQETIIDRIYAITSPDSNTYRNNWFKTQIEGIILTVHRSITGTWGGDTSSISTGDNSTYQSLTGYIYTPTLEELPFTSTLLNNYMQIYIICMMFVFFMLVIMVLLNLRSFSEGMIILSTMFVALLFPYILISNSVNISNSISDSLYSDRFDFWAISQHQTARSSLVGITAMSDKEASLSVMSASSDLSTTESGVKVKWMSPKKTDLFQSIYGDSSLSDSFVLNMTIFKWLFSSTIYDSEFVDTEVEGSYLYRTYNTIATEAEAYASWVTTISGGSSTISMTDPHGVEYTFSNMSSDYVDVLGTLNNDEYYIGSAMLFDNGYLMAEKNADGSNDEYVQYDKDKIVVLESLKSYAVLGETNTGDNNTGESLKNIGIAGNLNDELSALLIQEVEDLVTLGELSTGFGVYSNLPVTAVGDEFSNSVEDASLAIFLKNTEGPYYYFYTILKNTYQVSGSFKTSLIDSKSFKVDTTEFDKYFNQATDGSILKSSDMNKNISGCLTDFLYLEGLFSSVIPYLNDANDYVSMYKRVYGMDVETYNFEYSYDEDTDTLNNYTEYTVEDSGLAFDDEFATSEDRYNAAVTKKNNINKVWNMYSPWVDSLYDMDISETVYSWGNSMYVYDTLLPAAYLDAGRTMIFSEAEMTAKGYNYSQLTDVEKKIQAVTEATYTDLMYLINYYDMDDDVLLAIAAMYATFNFNTEFSQKNLLGDDVMLYPQGFELKNFNYDAFMRLALLNTTGESVFTSDDLYEVVLTKTSIITGILLIGCDIIACILIPTIKYIILLALLFLGLLLCITTVVNKPEKLMDTIMKSVVLPTFLFMMLNIVFAYVMSALIGDGLTAYVGSKSVNFVTNDPTVTLLLMIIVGVAYLFGAVKILKAVKDAFEKFGVGSIFATAGILGAGLGAVTKRVGRAANRITGGAIKGIKNANARAVSTASAIGAGAVGAMTTDKEDANGKPRKHAALKGFYEGARRGSIRGIADQRLEESKQARLMSGQRVMNKNEIDTLANYMSGPHTDEEWGKARSNSSEKQDKKKDNAQAENNLNELQGTHIKDLNRTKGGTVQKVSRRTATIEMVQQSEASGDITETVGENAHKNGNNVESGTGNRRKRQPSNKKAKGLKNNEPNNKKAREGNMKK